MASANQPAFSKLQIEATSFMQPSSPLESNVSIAFRWTAPSVTLPEVKLFLKEKNDKIYDFQHQKVYFFLRRLSPCKGSSSPGTSQPKLELLAGHPCAGEI